MKLAYLSSAYPRAAGAFVQTEIDLLRRAGYVVSTFSIRRTDANQHVSVALRADARRTTNLLDSGLGSLFASCVAEGVQAPVRLWRAIAMAASTGGGRGFGARLRQIAYLLAGCRLARCLRSGGVEHLHVHGAGDAADVAMYASVVSGVPYSMTVHGSSVFFRAEEVRLGEKVARSKFTACISHFCRSQCMVFVAPEHWSKLEIIRCGLGSGFLARETRPIPSDPRFVCVGRLSPEKAQGLLIEAVARLRDRGVGVELVLVGDGETRGELEELICARGLEEQVRITGFLDSCEVRREILDARALVLASFAEGLPVVLMEALALGRPVICSQLAGIPELVRDGVSGWLIPPGSVDAVAEALWSAAEANSEELAAMGKAGAARVRELHDAEREVRKLADLIRS